MRNLSISNLFASVVTNVIDVIAVAGFATRSFLHHLNMRERMGNRLEQCQADVCLGLILLTRLLLGSKRPAMQQPTFALAYGKSAQAVYAAPRLSQARASWRG